MELITIPNHPMPEREYTVINCKTHIYFNRCRHGENMRKKVLPFSVHRHNYIFKDRLALDLRHTAL
jgi:hypothetical protein